MNVIYRLTSIPSSNPSPIYYDDKLALNIVCLESFLKAFSDIDYSITFLLDHCDKNYPELLKGLVNVPFTCKVMGVGINETMLESYRLASELEDYVLFQECDYMYQGVIGKKYLSAMKTLGIVSPYDHPNFYFLRQFHREECRIKVVDNHHFRTAERNTMTWGCHSSIIKEHREIFDRYGYLDGEVWYDLKAEGVDLWTPIPAFATHMVTDCLSPGIDWKEVWQSIQ